MKILTLFDPCDFEVRKPANQTDFEERYKDVLAVFPAMVDEAFTRLNRDIYPAVEPASRDRNMMAVFINGLLKGQLVYKFREYCSHYINNSGGRFKLQKQNYEWLYIKKLDLNKKPSNIETDNTVKILKQLSDSDLDTQANVFLGYVANRDNSQADSVYAVYIVDKKVEWFTDLRDFSERHKSISEIKPITPISKPKLKEGTVTIKKVKNE